MSETAQLENLALASGEGTSEHTPDKTARSSQIKEHLNRALSRLSDRERAVFMLRHYHDLPLSEIATTLRVRTGTVKSLLFRGVQKLRRELSFYQQELEV